MSTNMTIDTDPQQQDAALSRRVVGASFSRHALYMFTALSRILSFLFLVWLSIGAAQANDSAFVGRYKKEAWCYDQRGYGVMDSDKWLPCKKKEYDTLVIHRAPEGLYQVEFSFVQFATTPGTCELSGLFQLKDKRLVVSEKDAELAAQSCVMEIEITPEAFLFRDPNNSCQRDHCGRNQNIDGESYPRRRRK